MLVHVTATPGHHVHRMWLLRLVLEMIVLVRLLLLLLLLMVMLLMVAKHFILVKVGLWSSRFPGSRAATRSVQVILG